VAEARLIEIKIKEEANGEAQKIRAESDAYYATTIANAQR
jgi:hypothetical protein